MYDLALCNHIWLSSKHADPEIDAAIARAERRRGKLERMSDIGMELVEQVDIHAAAATTAVNEYRVGNPARAFAAVSRAVRLTLALETRIDEQTIAMRNSEFKPLVRSRRTPAADILAAPVTPPSPERLGIRDEVLEAIYREVGNITDARRLLERLDEDLLDRETYDHLLRRPRREAVETICADLGLAPDWSLWSDDAGFARDAPGQRVLW